MNFKYIPNPINYGDGFYGVKEAKYIAINTNGEIKHLGVDKVFTPAKTINGYRVYGDIPVHRIVALTFIPAYDDPDKLHVNHINGDKSDNRLSNLEWVTPQENTIHSYISGLRKDNRKVELKDLETGEVREFPTLQDCGRYFNVNGGSIYQWLNLSSKNKRSKIPFKIKYDIRYKDGEWVGLSRDDIIGIEENHSARLVYCQFTNDARKDIVFNSIRTASEYLEISRSLVSWYLAGKGTVSKGNDPHFCSNRGCRLTYLRDTFKTGKEIRKILDKSELVFKDYQFNKFPTKRKPSPIRVTNLTTGEYKDWPSLQVYADEKQLNKGTIERYIHKNNGIRHGFKFEYLEKTIQYRKDFL